MEACGWSGKAFVMASLMFLPDDTTVVIGEQNSESLRPGPMTGNL